MLSMKSSTSCPSWSRKYSATVSPVKATRARAPGGSFICPYTSATLEVLSLREMTPDSIISWYKSLPNDKLFSTRGAQGAQLRTFTGTFSDSSKHRVTTMGLGHVVDQLHDEYSFAHTGTAEETNFTSFGVGGQKIYHLKRHEIP
ncbi:hypothetical protein HUJ05_005922 [Dendroctonus ponderosae]|nr:hypothetical protein HUJ05_005922 [Dendroctonus ponderosae]